jgi:hypothetical protein
LLLLWQVLKVSLVQVLEAVAAAVVGAKGSQVGEEVLAPLRLQEAVAWWCCCCCCPREALVDLLQSMRGSMRFCGGL